MAQPPVPEDLSELLARPNAAVIATLRPDGWPHTVATWYAWEHGRILVNMDGSRARLAWMREDPRVALTVFIGDGWYAHVSLRGRIASMQPDEDLADIDRLARHYRGEPYADRESPRVSAWIDVTSWHRWQV